MNKTLKKILWPLVWCRRQYDNYLMKNNPEKLFCLRYKRCIGHKLNIDNPQTLYEKIAYMAFRTDTSKWSVLADKVKVREYICSKGYEKNVPQIYGVWNKASDIDFAGLPSSFVIKTNNASATNIIVADKSKIDEEKVRVRLDKWLKWEYGYETCQPHYSRIKPQILAEEFLIDHETTKRGVLLIDYKFYCINGSPMYVQVLTDRKPNTHDIKVQIFDMDWNSHPEYVSKVHTLASSAIVKPASFEKMKEIVRVLAEGFPFVRVDLYDINGTPIFGELSFTPGFDTFTQVFQEELGRKCDISNM